MIYYCEEFWYVLLFSESCFLIFFLQLSVKCSRHSVYYLLKYVFKTQLQDFQTSFYTTGLECAVWARRASSAASWDQCSRSVYPTDGSDYLYLSGWTLLRTAREVSYSPFFFKPDTSFTIPCHITHTVKFHCFGIDCYNSEYSYCRMMQSRTFICYTRNNWNNTAIGINFLVTKDQLIVHKTVFIKW